VTADEAAGALVGALEAEGVGDGRCELADVWPVYRAWLAQPVDGAQGRIAFEALVNGSDWWEAGEGTAWPSDTEAGVEVSLEFFRNVQDGPDVGMALTYRPDEDWRARPMLGPGTPFFEEVWQDHGLVATPDHLGSVERSHAFRHGLRKRCLAFEAFGEQESLLRFTGRAQP